MPYKLFAVKQINKIEQILNCEYVRDESKNLFSYSSWLSFLLISFVEQSDAFSFSFPLPLPDKSVNNSWQLQVTTSNI